MQIDCREKKKKRITVGAAIRYSRKKDLVKSLLSWYKSFYYNLSMRAIKKCYL